MGCEDGDPRAGAAVQACLGVGVAAAIKGSAASEVEAIAAVRIVEGAEARSQRARRYGFSLLSSNVYNYQIVVEKLTKNVNENHLREIFGAYGSIRDLDMPINRQFNTNRGTAYILFYSASDAEAAIAHMHEAQLDGAIINVSIVVPRRKFSRSPPPARRVGPGVDRYDPRPGPPTLGVALQGDMVAQIREGATWIRIGHGHTQGLVPQDLDLREVGPGHLLQGLVLDRLTLEGGVLVAGGRAPIGLEGGGEALATAATPVLATEVEARVGPEVAQDGEGDERHWEI
ncbi:MAG: hypothetical protein M1840_003676 [Geoglossum simile]|nr:MAG: hypothetical protein M1840_003676 [Geoglossum simile]